jgi:uncharacterized protein
MEEKKIMITGGTGFVGRYLTEELMKLGHFTYVVSRTPEKYKGVDAKNQRFISWDEVPDAMQQTDIVVNLAGENLFGKRWTDQVKKRILDSRIEATQSLVSAMEKLQDRPELLVSVSGINYYKASGDQMLDEESEAGNDFLADVCKKWETEARKAEQLGVRVATPRIGIVLEENGGVVEKMRLPFKLFAGGPLGSGDQYMSWVHMRDLCRALIFPMENQNFSGSYNACAPNPVTMNELAKTMGSVMNRPSLFRVPEFLLKTLLGEAAQPVLSSLRVQPKKLQQAGFEFEYEYLEPALGDIL